MNRLGLLLVACLVIQAVRHGLETQELEAKIKALETVECPEPKTIIEKISVPQIVTVKEPCEPCEVCDCSNVHDWCYYENQWSNE